MSILTEIDDSARRASQQAFTALLADGFSRETAGKIAMYIAWGYSFDAAMQAVLCKGE